MNVKDVLHKNVRGGGGTNTEPRDNEPGMGQGIIRFYQTNVKTSWKVAFLSALIIGLVAHMYKFANLLPNQDSVFNYYDDQNIVTSGRWFLSIACGFSSYYDLSWLIGLLSLMLIGLSSVVVIEFFSITNPIAIILVSGILSVFPNITETFFYEYTADGYMLGILLAIIAAWLAIRQGFWHSVLAGVCICLSCAIYQAYVSYFLLLVVCHFILMQLEQKMDLGESVKFVGKQILIFVGGLLVYYLLWKLCMYLQGVEATNYQGIDKVEQFELTNILYGGISAVKAFVLFFIEWNVLRNGLTLYGFLNLLFLAALSVEFIVAILRTKTYYHTEAMLLILISLLIIPFCVCIWCFVSTTIFYRPMMLGSSCILYVFAIVLAERYCHVRLKDLTGFLIAVILFNNAIQANISYYYLERCYEQTYATTLEMVLKMRALADEKVTSYAVVGNIRSDVALDSDPIAGRNIHQLSTALMSTLAWNHVHITNYIANTFDFDLTPVPWQMANELGQLDLVQEMDCWPNEDSVQIINDTIVIKLDNYIPGEE